MQLSFENKELRTICEDEEEAIRNYGDEVAYQLQNRLSDILSADTIFDVVAGNPYKTGEPSYSYYVINLSDKCQMIVKACDRKKWYINNIELDWNKVNHIKLVNIQLNHE